MKQTFYKILEELSRYKFRMLIVILALTCTSLATISFGYILRDLIDNGIAKGNLNSLNESIKHMALAILALGIGSFFRSYYIYVISNRVMSDVKYRIFESLLKQSIEKISRIKITDYLNRFSHDLTFIGETIVNLLSISLRNAITFLGGIFMMFTVNLKLSLLTSAMLPLTMVLVKLIGVKIRRFSEQTLEKKSSLEDVVSEALNNITIIYTMGLNQYSLDNMSKQTKKYNSNHEQYLRARSSFFASAIIAVTGVILLVIWIGGKDVSLGKISSGDMVAFIFYALMSAFSLGSIAEIFGELQKYLTGAKRVYEIEDRYEEEEETHHDKDQERVTINPFGTIKPPYTFYFGMHKFSYSTRKDALVLKYIKFSLYPGEFIGMAGPSGSGKSTILKLLVGIYKAKICEVRINNVLVDPSTDSSLRAKMSYVPQDTFLFSTSIKENILLGRKYNKQKLEKVLDVCGLDEIIEELPDGIDTYIGEKGTQMSGGQKQRIAIARSIYGDPELLLMDEAMSALDNKSEIELLGKLRLFMKGKIIVSVAHRISSISDADRIFFVNKGEIESIGPHNILVKNSKRYAELVKQ